MTIRRTKFGNLTEKRIHDTAKINLPGQRKQLFFETSPKTYFALMYA